MALSKGNASAISPMFSGAKMRVVTSALSSSQCLAARNTATPTQVAQASASQGSRPLGMRQARVLSSGSGSTSGNFSDSGLPRYCLNFCQNC